MEKYSFKLLIKFNNFLVIIISTFTIDNVISGYYFNIYIFGIQKKKKVINFINKNIYLMLKF